MSLHHLAASSSPVTRVARGSLPTSALVTILASITAAVNVAVFLGLHQ